MLKKYTKILIAVIILAAVVYAGLGIYDYAKWAKAKKAVAAGGFTYQCGANKVVFVTPNCKQIPGPPFCSCAECALVCEGATQLIIEPQAVCSQGALNPAVVCISEDVKQANSKTMPTPLEALAGKQAIFAGFSNMMAGNGVIATPSLAASNIEKVISWFDYAMAIFK